jgi:hypothetical protein
MTASSVRDHHRFACDTCDKEITIISDDFREAWGSLKEEGWTTFKLDGEWMHECPSCSD